MAYEASAKRKAVSFVTSFVFTYRISNLLALVSIVGGLQCREKVFRSRRKNAVGDANSMNFNGCQLARVGAGGLASWRHAPGGWDCVGDL